MVLCSTLAVMGSSLESMTCGPQPSRRSPKKSPVDVVDPGATPGTVGVRKRFVDVGVTLLNTARRPAVFLPPPRVPLRHWEDHVDSHGEMSSRSDTQDADSAEDTRIYDLVTANVTQIHELFSEIFFKSTQIFLCGSIFKNSDVLKRKNRPHSSCTIN